MVQVNVVVAVVKAEGDEVDMVAIQNKKEAVDNSTEVVVVHVAVAIREVSHPKLVLSVRRITSRLNVTLGGTRPLTKLNCM